MSRTRTFLQNLNVNTCSQIMYYNHHRKRKSASLNYFDVPEYCLILWHHNDTQLLIYNRHKDMLNLTSYKQQGTRWWIACSSIDIHMISNIIYSRFRPENTSYLVFEIKTCEDFERTNFILFYNTDLLRNTEYL